MQTITVHQAQTNLMNFLKEGEDILIVKGKTPVAKIVPLVTEKNRPLKLGLWKGKVWVSSDLDDENEKINKLLYGEKILNMI